MILRLYGRHAPFFFGSPYEGTRDNKVETILHEWGHIAQIASWTIPLREGEVASDLAFEYLETAPSYLAERNEIRTVAIAVGVARALMLPIVLGPLAWSALQNSRLLGADDPGVERRKLHRSHERQDFLERLAVRAGRTPVVRRCVQEILDLLDREWSKSMGRCKV